MAQITKNVDKTLVNGSEIFIYTINAAYSGLTQPAQEGKIVDFFPSKIKYILPPVGGQIQSITQTPVTGGTQVSFNLGSVSSGTSLSFTVACYFGPGRVDNDSFTNKADLIADGVTVAQVTAPTVNLKLDENFILYKLASPSNIVNPGEEITLTLSLMNGNDPGASINNVVITDTLPSQLIPVTTFTPIGNDIPTNGYSDPSANGVTGSWSGNTLTFNLPKYNGARYDVKFKVKVASNVTPGQTFTNTGKWTMNGTARNDAPLTFSIYDPSTAGFTIYKYGTRTTVVGGPITYDIVNSNSATVAFNNYVLEDTIPSQVDINAYRLTASTGLINYTISIALASNPTTYIPVIQNVPSGSQPYTSLASFIPAGDRVAKFRLSAQTLGTAGSGHTLSIFGITNTTAVFGERFLNKATATSGNITKDALWSTDVNGASDLAVAKYLIPNLAAYYPLEEFKVNIVGSANNTITVEPVLADLLPKGLRYVTDSEYFIYYDYAQNKSFDSRLPGFPIPLPTRQVDINYTGNGDDLIRWSFENYILPISCSISVIFTAFVEINPPNTFTNTGYEGMPGNNALFVYNESTDPLDVDGDGLTNTDRISKVEVSGVILTTSEFSIKKLVKGEEDLEYTASGLTVQGGDASYKLQVTNNQSIDLKNIEIVDILPYVGDTGVILTDVQRGSQFEVYATSTVSAEIVNVIGDPVDPNPVIVIEYSTSNNPQRFDETGNPIGTGTWSTTPPADITTLRSIKVTTGPNVILKPYDRLIVTIGAKAPVGVAVGKIAYNSFAVRANKIIGTNIEPLLPTEPPKVALTIKGTTNGSIGHFVWEDLNGNGIYDSGEPGVNGVTVELYDDKGTLLKSTVTSNSSSGDPGYYLFTGLSAGVYQVKFIPFGDYSLTIQKATVPNGSTPDPTTGLTPFINLSQNQNVTFVNAGVITTDNASIGDFVWNDLNKDGIYQPGEPGVNGVTVELYDDKGLLLKTTVTANNSSGDPGFYNFYRLPAGSYKVKFIPSVDYKLTIQKDTVPDGSKPNPTTGFTNVISLLAGQHITDIDAGVYEFVCDPPVIDASNRCVYLGSTFDPMEGVSATDCSGKDITDQIIVKENDVDVNVVGVYSVTYSVTDYKGQTTIKTITVKVCKITPRQQAINDIFESVALEKTAISHILNAEGEKIKKAKELNFDYENMIAINQSVKDMIDAVLGFEAVLQDKLSLFEDSGCDDGCCSGV